MKPKYKLAILKNETNIDHLQWVEACERYQDIIEHNIIDLIAENWFEEVINDKYDFFLTRPPDRVGYFKQLYDERIYIINQVLNFPIYPRLVEVLFYENKRFLSYYLNAMNIPHPKTWVFYKKEEALSFIENCELPIVVKTNIGAAGRGVKIIKNRSKANKYVENAFSKTGIKRTFLPNFRRGDYFSRLRKRLSNFSESVEYFKEKKFAATIEPQKWFVIFQEYIKSDYEWRCVVIGDSYFGHKKLRSFGEKMSGTSKVGWDLPEKELLDLLKGIVDKNNFWSQAIDLFYDEKRGYLINELQCFWGSKHPHQMMKNGTPGRFVYREGTWQFEEGSFNQNNSYELRLQHVMKFIKDRDNEKNH